MIFAIRYHGAGVAQGAQVLRREETEAPDIAEAARSATVDTCTMALRAIFDDRCAERMRDLGQRCDLRNQAIEMRHDHRLDVCNRAQGFAKPGGIHQERRAVDVDERGLRSHDANRRRRVHACVRHGQDRVTRTYVEASQRKLERVGAVGYRDAVPGAAVMCKLMLKCVDFGAEHEASAARYAGQCAIDFRLQRHCVPTQVVYASQGHRTYR